MVIAVVLQKGWKGYDSEFNSARMDYEIIIIRMDCADFEYYQKDYKSFSHA